MISVRLSRQEELATFFRIQNQSHAKGFVNYTSLEAHEANFSDPSIAYLSIEKAGLGLVGYCILALDETPDSVEFRSIVVDENARGVGQFAITLMEQFCATEFSAQRIWLDVYDDNDIGKHIYEKLGYRRFETRRYDCRLLHFYEKVL